MEEGFFFAKSSAAEIEGFGMAIDLAIATGMILVTVLFHTLGLILLTRTMNGVIQWFRLHRHDFGKIMAIVSTMLGLFFLHAIEIWAWALLFLVTGAIGVFEDALYFSTVTFSTVGYGDITVGPQWRMLAALEAINRFLLIGWSTAYLVSASTRHGPFRIGEHF